MKRAFDDDSGHGDKRKRRPKASEACLTCRKAKTRCEPALNSKRDGCHRCTVLALLCSFINNATSSATPGSSSTASTPTATEQTDDQTSIPKPLLVPRFDATGIQPDDILLPATSAFEKGHWTTAPMAAMQEFILRHPSQRFQEQFIPHTEGTLNTEQIEYLRNVFEAHYTPRLNIPYTLPSRTSPPTLNDFLTLARCTVAARHLVPSVFSSALPRLQQLVEHALLVQLHSVRSASLETVQALLILSLWGPTIGSLPSDVQDGSLIARTAVKMAISLGLDSAMDRLAEFRQRFTAGVSMTLQDEQDHRKLIYNTQLWSSVCNAEWLLCLGTSHATTSRPVPSMYATLNPAVFSGSVSATDLRSHHLYHTARVVLATSWGLSLSLTDFGQFTHNIEAILSVSSSLRATLLPMQAIFPHERSYLDIIILKIHWSRLLVLIHGLTQIRLYIDQVETDTSWLVSLDQMKTPIANRWGAVAEDAGQSVIITFLDTFERGQTQLQSRTPQLSAQHGTQSNSYHPLATAPDFVFVMVLFAVSAVLHIQATVIEYRHRRSITKFATDALLLKLADALDAVAISEDHCPRRVANVVRELKRVWDAKIVTQVQIDHSWPHIPRGVTSGDRRSNTYNAGETLTGDPWAYNTSPNMARYDWDIGNLRLTSSYPHTPGGDMASSIPPSSTPFTLGTMGSSTQHVDDEFWTSFLESLEDSRGF